MLSQKLKYWTKFIRETEMNFQRRAKAALVKLWNKDPDKITQSYADGSFVQLAWYRHLPIYPPDNFDFNEFKITWPHYGWGESKIEDCRILARLLQLQDRDGNFLDLEKIARNLLEVDLNRHQGKLSYERRFILWTLHRELIRQNVRDQTTQSQLYQRDVA